MKNYIIVNDGSLESAGDLSIYNNARSAEKAHEVYDVNDPRIYIIDIQGNQYNMRKRDEYSVQIEIDPEKDKIPPSNIRNLLMSHLDRGDSDLAELKTQINNDEDIQEIAEVIYLSDPNPYASLDVTGKPISNTGWFSRVWDFIFPPKIR